MSLEDKLHPFLASYIGWPQWMKSALGGAYSLLPLSLRRGPEYARFVEVLQDTSLRFTRKYAQSCLTETLRWTLETVPAYDDYRSLAGELAAGPEKVLAQLPLISKNDIKADLSRYLSAAMSESARHKTFTGGSTANPMMFYLQKGVSRSKEYAFMENFHARVGMTNQHSVLTLRGRTVPTAMAGKQQRLWMFEPIKKQLILSSDHLEPSYMPQYEEALRGFCPPYIQAFPSALYPLAKWLADHPLPEFTQGVRGIMLFSENVYDFQMRLFRQVFDCPVMKHYGHSERGLMAATLPDDERYHFWPQYGHFELVDGRGQTITQAGELGEIVGTSFDNRVMPFVRYRTGDMAMLSASPSAIPGYPVVERIEGRLQEFIVTRDRRLISICTLGAAHFDELAAVDAIQYEQHEPGQFVLKVVSANRITDAIRQSIAAAVEEKTQHGCTAKVVQVETIPRTSRGKHQMLLQHLDLSGYLAAGLDGEA
jgi:phenylacetate-CoA ligase